MARAGRRLFPNCFNDKPTGDATCLNRGEANPPILEFSPAGRLLRRFGVGLFAHPHGFTVDRNGNLWTTDSNAEETILGMPAKNAQGVPLGQTVFKISAEGKLLMMVGRPGVGGDGLICSTGRPASRSPQAVTSSCRTAIHSTSRTALVS
jgi:hypothetical protein